MIGAARCALSVLIVSVCIIAAYTQGQAIECTNPFFVKETRCCVPNLSISHIHKTGINNENLFLFGKGTVCDESIPIRAIGPCSIEERQVRACSNNQRGWRNDAPILRLRGTHTFLLIFYNYVECITVCPFHVCENVWHNIRSGNSRWLPTNISITYFPSNGIAANEGVDLRQAEDNPCALSGNRNTALLQGCFSLITYRPINLAHFDDLPKDRASSYGDYEYRYNFPSPFRVILCALLLAISPFLLIYSVDDGRRVGGNRWFIYFVAGFVSTVLFFLISSGNL